MENALTPFEGKEMRKAWHDEQWYFAIIDVMAVLADTDNPRQYWTKVKKNLTTESQLQPFWLQLKMQAADGKFYKTDCANTDGILRIVMSVPSPKAEPLKLWLAQVGSERIQETENPELGFERMVEIYKAKGYTDEWIERRMQSIETRKQLTNEWKNRGVKEGKEYSNLTAVIAKGTFGLTPTEHKDLKGLTKPSHNLRDHMTPLELIFTALGEELTRSESVKDDAQGFDENRNSAVKGGNMAGKARKLIEEERGEKVVSDKNYLKELKEDNKNKLPSDPSVKKSK